MFNSLFSFLYFITFVKYFSVISYPSKRVAFKDCLSKEGYTKDCYKKDVQTAFRRGMGGQLNYWGLWIDCEYGKGESNESCTTYRDYIQLSKRKDFKIRNLEVFGIGDKLEKDKDGEDNYKRSVLERNLEDRVLLELSGKHMNSEGVREPDMDF